ncbi:MAG: class I SAM-dependent methyltransferase [Deltaproteobacteria bacterium]|nr:class I SAM-dependent methyltransferase [Deltaproteobacteria bacterium]MBI3293612.1 class I SAM-dependent methyltransferase [Deltaproteobacteria bacterium]
MSPQAFSECRNEAGLTSYEWLADTLSHLPSPTKIVDLACGDGYLIPLLQKKVGNVEIIGIDMSPAELTVARCKNLGPSVAFLEAMAHKTGLEDNSIDAVVCHMAFMLMTPIEPVVAEIQRILKPGGIFSAVIGNRPDTRGPLVTVRETVGKFMHKEFPKMAAPVTGDPRVESEDGLSEIIRPLKMLGVRDDQFGVNVEPGGFWNYIKNMYLVGLLSDEVRSRLEIAILASLGKPTGMLRLDSPMRRFTAEKMPWPR